jgi:hypothetical protein
MLSASAMKHSLHAKRPDKVLADAHASVAKIVAGANSIKADADKTKADADKVRQRHEQQLRDATPVPQTSKQHPERSRHFSGCEILTPAKSAKVASRRRR